MGSDVIIDSRCYSLKDILSNKYIVDFYQREYVWEKVQLEDLINDLSIEFLKVWKEGDKPQDVKNYHPYFMGEVIVSQSNNINKLVDGQQRLTTFSLILMYINNNYKGIEGIPNIKDLIETDDFGEKSYNPDVKERKECLDAINQCKTYEIKSNDSLSIKNIVNRYSEISDCWSEKITEENIVNFTYWLINNVMFSKVWTTREDFAYVIFETMNDRGLSLTQVEMLRSYLLANIDENKRQESITIIDDVINLLRGIKLTSKSKAEFEFFKILFRSKYAEGSSTDDDFVRIGKEFHRWVRDNESRLELDGSETFYKLLTKIEYYANFYKKINDIILNRNDRDYFYVLVNSDYGFTLQYPLLMSAINYGDSENVVNEKIRLVSKYLTKILSWRIWNGRMISQSSMESHIFELCKKIRNMSIEELIDFTAKPINENICQSELEGSPILNQQNKNRLLTLISLITEIVARESKESDYILNKPNIEVEHIWSNHFDEHLDEFDKEDDFATTRNNIGDLLVLPKSFNASYGDKKYEIKVEQYFSQNILAQTLNYKKYVNNPQFIKFVNESSLEFKSYKEFKKNSISERADLYKQILYYNFCK